MSAPYKQIAGMRAQLVAATSPSVAPIGAATWALDAGAVRGAVGREYLPPAGQNR
ncbi:hypothetical protein [Gulosibacter bifidus]|uniref:Uncharacterized protein n=1 Tax=Gulosibacter bifidus TaxID=272239 RepID=A0ABW5RKR8_9MICO|nr:hypothetical protein [Gulosibacter bifidus]